ncbi:Cilia- and flagella-associated protein 91 [Phytophthora infestans]|uniref:Cilia- and flagella-associated protein 91 n=1 Tax=Phytophthora infestans TaxID=4787 RepID=A0A833SEU5_PHYIN|nr:Cilia- and flagella-associated protein 91 [Phytophthora infestans]KAF4142786.1 Cilia- and flagella-associated protein 91 [Phytophthora infestans]
MSRAVPSRVLDAVYDTVYTVSSSGGSYRKGVYRAPSKPANTSSTINDQNPTEGSHLISGSERVKFHRRPVLPRLQAEPPEVLLAPTYVVPTLPLKHRDVKELNSPHVAAEVLEGATRSVSIQTIYRDSEAQTDPYTPDYTIQKTATGIPPEIEALVGLKYARGQLPIGHAELELIERNRNKRAFETSLPPMTDEASLLLRKAMLEAQETREWAYREAEIDAFHDQRADLLQQALAEREKENAFLSEQRLEALRQRLLHEKENALEAIQQERVTALRKLTKKRVERQHERGFGTPKPERGRDFIAEYANFGSQVYAPITRDGKAGKVKVRESGIGKPRFLQFDALRELESALPAQMVQPTAGKYKPCEKRGRTAKERKQAAIEAHLLKMEFIINKYKEHNDVDKAARGARRSFNSPVSRRASKRQQQVIRPPTPDYALVHVADVQEHDVEDVVRLLQKLIRGRAVQNMMFEGKERRDELIAELRAADDQLVLQRRNELALLPGSGAEGIDRVANAAKTRVEGEVVSEMFDFLSKELSRSREMAKMRAFVIKATEERRVREVEEGGRRQAEDILREREDEVFRRVMQIHQETSRDFVVNVLEEIAQEKSHVQALNELHIRSAGVDGIVLHLEDELDSDETVVRELVESFLIPRVQRQHVRRQVTQEQKKYVSAAHALLTEMAASMSHPPCCSEAELKTSQAE